eukprot:4480371-Pleurochrysis_carterae.AAC.1
MDLQNKRFDYHDGVVVNANRVQKLHSVKNNGLVLLTLRDLFVQSLTQLDSHARIFNLLRLHLRGAADHSLTRGGYTAELHVRTIPRRGDSGRHSERHR